MTWCMPNCGGRKPIKPAAANGLLAMADAYGWLDMVGGAGGAIADSIAAILAAAAANEAAINEGVYKMGCKVNYFCKHSHSDSNAHCTIVFVLMHIRCNANQNRDLASQECNANLPVCTHIMKKAIDYLNSNTMLMSTNKPMFESRHRASQISQNQY